LKLALLDLKRIQLPLQSVCVLEIILLGIILDSMSVRMEIMILLMAVTTARLKEVGNVLMEALGTQILVLNCVETG